DRDRTRGAEARRKLADQGYEVRMVRLDVTDFRSVRAATRELADEGTDVDVLVNNAGVCPQGTILGARWRVYEAAFATNLFGVLRVCRGSCRGWSDEIGVVS